jgi:hypothetical protein
MAVKQAPHGAATWVMVRMARAGTNPWFVQLDSALTITKGDTSTLASSRNFECSEHQRICRQIDDRLYEQYP